MGVRPSPSGLSRVQGVRASHIHKSKCVRCLLITVCERLWLWKKVWGGGVEIIQGRIGLGPEKRVGKKRELMDGVRLWASQGPPALLSAASGSSG